LVIGTSVGSVSAAVSEINAANTLAGKWVISSQSDFTGYRLGDTITRKEMMKIVMNLSGKNVPDTCNGTFPDVTNDWGCKYIESALANGFIAANATFRPDDTITKAESIKLALGARGISKAYNTSDWQADWMNTAYDNGLLSAKYSDHNTQALRGWIFELGANPIQQRSVASTEVEEEDIGLDFIEDLLQEESIEEPVVLAGQFTDYSESLVGENETTVLFFHASWCPSCRTAEANFLKDDFSGDDIAVLKVDYDSSIDLRKKYWVTTQHTFVQIDGNGELIKKWTGSNSLSAVKSKL